MPTFTVKISSIELLDKAFELWFQHAFDNHLWTLTQEDTIVYEDGFFENEVFGSELVDSYTLFYKMNKGIVSVEDYIAWSHTLLKNNVSSTSLNIISSLAPNHNIFEVEDYFKKALKELQMELPTIEPSSRAYIALLATQILKEENENEIFNLAQEIISIVIDLQYPEDLMEWYNISEMIDRIQYDKSPLDFNKEDIKSKIKGESRHLLASL